MNFKTTKLADICERIISGGTPSTENESFWNGEIPWITSADIDSSFSVTPKKFITDKSKANILPSGNILVVTRVGLGKVATNRTDLAFSQDIQGLLIDKNNVDKEYLVYCLSKKVEKFKSVSRGATIKGVTREDLASIQIPLPPLPTQKHIAAILDKADALRQQNRQLLEHYDALLQSTFMEMFGDPVKNLKGWEVKKLGDLGKWSSGGTPLRSKTEYFDGKIPWLSSGELNEMFVYDSLEHISEKAILESASKKIRPGSLLLGMYDTAAFKSSIAKRVITCNQAIAFSLLDENVCNTLFVYIVIQYGKEEFKKLQRGVRQKNLNLSLIRGIQVPLPPLLLQNHFAQIVTEIESQKQQAQTALAESEELFQSLLATYFGNN